MDQKPYNPFEKSQLILRDYLALDRTSMANERTLLAYVRTALALLIVGGTMLHVLESKTLHVLAVVFIVLAAITGTIGVVRFQKMHVAIKAAKNRPLNGSAPAGE